MLSRGEKNHAYSSDIYKRQLEASIRRTKDHLCRFEQQYNVTTAQFLREMTAEDLTGGDWEYVEWAGEAQLLQGLETELKYLECASSSGVTTTRA